jgi:hypothetical protein
MARASSGIQFRTENANASRKSSFLGLYELNDYIFRQSNALAV